MCPRAPRPGQSGGVTGLYREQVLDDVTATGRAYCRALSQATDTWLRGVLGEATGGDTRKLALVAVGGYGRGELAPGSDLDLVLLHDGRKDIATVAQALWYPLWDAKVKLGHAVRTTREALKLADDDLETATSFLAVRHIGGDPALTQELAERALAQWRKRARRWLDELARSVNERHRSRGEVAFQLEPELKEGRGGLRDVHTIDWVRAAGLIELPPDVVGLPSAEEILLAARVELHRRTAKRSDLLALQEQDAVAASLGYSNADALMADISSSARTIAWVSDEVWHRVGEALAGAAKPTPDQPVASGVVLRGRAVHLSERARPADDPTLVLTVAAAAARHRVPIARTTLERLALETPPFPDPWPAGAVDTLVAVLLEGHHAIRPLEALDQVGLLARVLPEWNRVRAKPQRNAYHRFTVDRHLLEAIANAGERSSRVARPDLLVLGALFHDLGKGYPGDHTEVGVRLVETIAPRMGLGADDTATLRTLVRLHLLLPDVATRRDISDEETINAVAAAVGDSATLELLHMLTEADSLATGSSAWSAWKAELVRDLVSRAAHVLGGGEVHEVAWSLFPSAELLAAMGAMQTRVSGHDDVLTVVAPDRPGVFSRVAGVLALHGLDVLSAQAHSDEQGMAASEFRVAPSPNGPHRWDRVEADLLRALQGQLALDARLAERARTYAHRRRAGFAGPTRVVVDNSASSNATVIEVHAADSIGVLYRITRAIADLQLDIRHAKVQTLGPEVVDAFYVRDIAGEKITEPFHLAELERAILHAV
jgi:[protein-PII] uridylyltransferase